MVEKMKLVRVQGTMPQLNEFIGSCCMDGRFDLEPATRYMSESLGDKGQFLVHTGQPCDVQGQLGQHIGGVGLAVQGIVQPYGLGVGGSNLLGIAQQRPQFDMAEVVAVRAVDGKFLGVGYELFGHKEALLDGF